MTVVTQADFDKLGDALKEKLSPLVMSPYFLSFMDKLLRDTCPGSELDQQAWQYIYIVSIKLPARVYLSLN